MNYEFAKELKAAGWPHHTDRCSNICQNEHIPTLSELIEACGDGFNGLDREEMYNDGNLVNVRWMARPTQKGAEVVYAPTPEEAVARLWLALNKKP